MVESTCAVRGDLHVQCVSKDGILQWECSVLNTVVADGKGLIASRLAGNSEGPVAYMSIGSSGAVTSQSMTALVAETARVPIALKSATGTQATFIAVFDKNIGTGTVAEAGLHTQLTGGRLVARTTAVTGTKAATDSLTITWTLTVN